jgi:hypothetical protein
MGKAIYDLALAVNNDFTDGNFKTFLGSSEI